MRPAQVLVAGGGIAGLACALALARHGHRVEVLEQAPRFEEFGAGIQLGPNATRRLEALGLRAALLRTAYRPAALTVRQAGNDQLLACLPLAEAMRARYGADYLCIHRADLHAVLLSAVRASGTVALNSAARVCQVVARAEAVCVSSGDRRAWEGDALVGADGVWGMVRQQVVPAGAAPRATGHTAWRALLPQSRLPAGLRSTGVTVWLGPRLHAVAYPVRRGSLLNVVVLAEAEAQGDARDWSQQASLATLQRATGRVGAGLQALLEAMPGWQAWTLSDRPPITSAADMAKDRIALAGDAAHPMLPYLAQGAGMAIEDGLALGEALAGGGADAVPAAFARYAAERWSRNARVQARARRNGHIFHAQGPLRWSRDAALRSLGARLLDQPWLFGG